MQDIAEIPLETFDPEATIEDARIILGNMMLESSLTAEEVAAIAGMYPAWSIIDRPLIVGEIVSHENVLYRTVQEHTPQVGWEPPVALALFAKCVPDSIIPEWVQPTGAQDVWHVGDFVVYAGWVWECTAGDASGNNSWAPGVYGWTKVEPV